MLKKSLYILLIALICVGLFSCSRKEGISMLYQVNDDYGDTGGQSLPIDINQTKISILVSSEFNDLSDKLVIKELSKRTGLEVSVLSSHPANLAQKTRTLLASNELPDILNSSLSLEELNNLGIKGVFSPINLYFSELPNFNRVFISDVERSRKLEELKAKDGNLYSFPKFDYDREVSNGLLYRKDILDKHQIPMWKNEEEFYQALKKLKEIYPDSQPYVSKLRTDIFSAWSPGWGIEFPGMFYDFKAKSWKYSGTDQRFYDMLMFMRKLYQEKLIADDFLTCSQTSWEGKMMESERVFATYDQINRLDYFNRSVENKYPNYDLRYGVPPGPVGKVRAVSSIGSGPFVLNNDKKLFSFKLLDYLLSPSGIELTSLGIRNKTYLYNSEGRVQYLGFSDDRISARDLEERYGLFINGLFRSIDKRSVYFHESEKTAEAYSMIAQEERILPTMPKPSFSKKEIEEIESIMTNLNYNAYSLASEFVLTSRFGETVFLDWKEKAQKLGVDRVVELYNTRKEE